MTPHTVSLVPGSVRKVCQLTGERDRERGTLAFNQTETRYGLIGTDLGSSFEHEGWLWFLFGDSWLDPDNGDAMAWSTATEPEPGIHLEFVTAGATWKRPFVMVPPGNPPVTTADFEVPIAGFSANGQMYVFYSTDRLPRDDDEPMRRTVLARARGTDPTDLEWLYDASDRRVVGRFINICPTVLDGGLAGLPFAGPALLMWGSGHYRKSHLYLACVPLNSVENRAAWQFCVGREAGSGQPLWSDQEADAAPLLVHPQIGEFSVSWLAPLGLWLLLYNCGDASRGIVFRVAAHPWGPWSHPQLAFGPSWPGLGYGHFMHVSWDAGGTDDLWDPGRGHEWGGGTAPTRSGASHEDSATARRWSTS